MLSQISVWGGSAPLARGVEGSPMSSRQQVRLDQELCILGGRRIVYPEFIQIDFCLNLAVLLKAVSTLGVAVCLRKESRLLNGRNMIISGGTGQLLHESPHFPLGTGAHGCKGCSHKKCRDIPSHFYFLPSHQHSPPLSSLPVTLSPVLPPLLSLSQVSYAKPELLQYSKKGLE